MIISNIYTCWACIWFWHQSYLYIIIKILFIKCISSGFQFYVFIYGWFLISYLMNVAASWFPFDSVPVIHSRGAMAAPRTSIMFPSVPFTRLWAVVMRSITGHVSLNTLWGTMEIISACFPACYRQMLSSKPLIKEQQCILAH